MTFWGWFTGAEKYNNIDRKLNTIMADLTALQAAANQITTDVAEAVARLDELGDKLAAGELTQADLDAVTATLTSASASLDEAVAADVDEDPAPVDPEPTEPAPVDPTPADPTEV